MRAESSDVNNQILTRSTFSASETAKLISLKQEPKSPSSMLVRRASHIKVLLNLKSDDELSKSIDLFPSKVCLTPLVNGKSELN